MSSENTNPTSSFSYRITVEGKIDPSWSEWLDGFTLNSRKEADEMTLTTISGFLHDQAALRGLLNRIWDLNLSVRSFEQVSPTLQFDKK